MELAELQACRGPQEWPASPAELSVSSLLEIEECPRRWSLRHARYPEIWTSNGYPIAPTPAALAGSAVHLALERITGELVRAGCESAHGGSAVTVMRQLGGYTTVIEGAAMELLDGLRSNPRVASRAGAMKRAVLRQVPQLRERLQKLLSRLRLVALPPRAGADVTLAARRRLGPGSYAEVRLHAPRIGWNGVADLLTVVEAGCEISDFKTGERSETHKFQLQVYALLWYRDSELNPEATLATRLIICYRDADVDVAPLNKGELSELERGLMGRSDAARAKLNLRPPPAVVGQEACARCQVRHLCSEYWHPATLRQLRPISEDEERYEDVELELVEPDGPGLWAAWIRASPSLERGKKVRLQVDPAHAAFMQAKRRLRITGARIVGLENFDVERNDVLISPSAWTEFFLLE